MIDRRRLPDEAGEAGRQQLNVNLNFQLPDPITDVLREVLMRTLLQRATTLPPEEQCETSASWDQSQDLTDQALQQQIQEAMASGALPSEPTQSATRPRRLTFRTAFRKHVLPSLRIEVKKSTLAGYTTAVDHFCRWLLRTGNHRSVTPMVISAQPELLSEFYRHQLTETGERPPRTSSRCYGRSGISCTRWE